MSHVFSNYQKSTPNQTLFQSMIVMLVVQFLELNTKIMIPLQFHDLKVATLNFMPLCPRQIIELNALKSKGDSLSN